METSALCDQVSQASFIKLSDASLWFVLLFFFISYFGKCGKIQGLSYSDTGKGGVQTDGEVEAREVWGKNEDKNEGEKLGKRSAHPILLK